MASRRINYVISESENLVMEYLWEHPEGKYFNEIMEYLNGSLHKSWKKQTINTFIKRLKDKGLVIAENDRGNKLYYPRMSYEEFKKGEANELLKELYQGSVFTFLSALTGGKKIDHEAADALRKMLEEDDTE